MCPGAVLANVGMIWDKIFEWPLLKKVDLGE